MNLNKDQGKYFFIFLASGLAFLLICILFRSSATKPIDKPLAELSCLEQDKVEAAKDAWGKMLTSHPFYTRQHPNEEEMEKNQAEDGPDLAAELDFMRTMDPALGAVPAERLYKANQEVEKELKNRAAITGVTWVERGPTNIGGRSRAVMFDPNDSTHKKVWAGAVGGGLWYTNDITVGSPVWNKVNDLWDNIAISTIAFNPANTQEIYVGTGEGYVNTGSQEGSGIWKSSNDGATWAVLAPTVPGAYNSASDFHYVQKIAIKNNGYIFAATRGYYVNSGGIMRSTNFGISWTKVLTVYTGSGTLYDRASDIEVAANGDLYCSFGISSDGKVFKSINANDGASGGWTDLSTNIVVGAAKRIELACAPSNSSYIYAVAHGGSGNNDIEWFKRSIDGGTTWSTLAIPRLIDDGTTHFTTGQAWYDLILAVHPTNADLVIAGGRDLHRSINGGTTWTQISDQGGGFSLPYVHADQHGLQFRPGSTNELISANDGGIYYSTNAGNSGVTPTFTGKINGYDVTQFYACAAKNESNSNYFLAGAQDNQTQKFTQPQANGTSTVIGGDGGFCHIDQIDPDIQVGESIYNNIFLSLDGGTSFFQIVGESSGLFINPTDYDNTRKIIYAAAGNDAIKRVSNLTAIPIAIANTDISIPLGTAMISALKVSPYNDVVFIGVANGRVYKLTNASTGSPSLARLDAGATPITTTGVVSNIDVGVDDSHLMVTYSNYGVISVWQTIDGGAHWYNKEGNLPDVPIRWAIYNPNNREQVLAATELGIWTTDNFGSANTSSAPVWGESVAALAHTRCDMIKYRAADKMLAVATHGRGLFTTDLFATATADFTSDATASCSGSLTVHFTDTSFKPNGSWAWDIDNNGTTDFTTQNPTYTYAAPGVYSVKLTINSGAATITKQNYIVVMASPPPNTGCTVPANMNNGNGAAIGIYRFALNTIDNSTSFNDGSYHDYSCSKATALNLNTTYNVTVQTGWYNAEGAGLYIDYNNNGVLDDAGESIVLFPPNIDGTRTLSFTTPASGIVTHKPLRARITSVAGYTPLDPCDVEGYGQAEDYTVYFNCTLLVTLNSGSASGSLPSAINCANPGDTIRISASLANQTITIPSAITLAKNLVFIGLGANSNITGTGIPQIFTVNAGVNAEFQNLIITAGTSLTSGAILNNGNLKLNNVNIHRNTGVTNATLIRNNPGATNTMVGLSFIWN